ncbi:hypothetical protein BDZ88DRAFT_454105 [Geranomyces variabilis]|nr:hypothetical protein BDZ88DRAFT_454105 [Geranomyces variabilis]KAJ3132910.1 hypothetical protein HDU90_006630 [Geranomyces variabilis]
MSSKPASPSANVPAPEVAGPATTNDVPAMLVSSADQQQAAETAPEVPAKDDAGKPGQNTTAAAADSGTTTVVSGTEGETDTTSATAAGGRKDIKRKTTAIKRASRFVGVAASRVVGFLTVRRKQPRTTAPAPVGESTAAETTAETEKDTLEPPAAGKLPIRKTSVEVIQDAAKAVVGEALEGFKTGKMDDETEQEPTAGDKVVTSSTDVKETATAGPGKGPATTATGTSAEVPQTATGSKDNSTAVVKEGPVAASSAT